MKLLIWFRQLKQLNWFRGIDQSRYAVKLVVEDFKDLPNINVGLQFTVTGVNRTTGEVYLDYC